MDERASEKCQRDSEISFSGQDVSGKKSNQRWVVHHIDDSPHQWQPHSQVLITNHTPVWCKTHHTLKEKFRSKGKNMKQIWDDYCQSKKSVMISNHWLLPEEKICDDYCQRSKKSVMITARAKNLWWLLPLRRSFEEVAKASPTWKLRFDSLATYNYLWFLIVAVIEVVNWSLGLV